jgi:hypothetical protein
LGLEFYSKPIGFIDPLAPAFFKVSRDMYWYRGKTSGQVVVLEIVNIVGSIPYRSLNSNSLERKKSVNTFPTSQQVSRRLSSEYR